jgi:rRNA maturation RNase YbeY
MRHLISRVERRAPDRMWESVDLVLLDDAGIEPLHRAHFGKPGPTDVISFAYPPLPGEARWRGEILVNAEAARREGAARRGAAREIALYIAHGFDHLSGADDASPADRRRMRRREIAWLKQYERAEPLDGLTGADPNRGCFE